MTVSKDGAGVCEDGVCVTIGEIVVPFDIKPGSCPNPVNVKNKGVLPVAILGTEKFDVTQIDPDTVKLGREGIEATVAPIRLNYWDVATPFEGELCDCHTLRGDGYLDMTLKFRTQDVVETLELRDGFEFKDPVPLKIIGNLKEEFGGTPFSGQDCIRWQ